jgi:hypothetical protein
LSLIGTQDRDIDIAVHARFGAGEQIKGPTSGNAPRCVKVAHHHGSTLEHGAHHSGGYLKEFP